MPSPDAIIPSLKGKWQESACTEHFCMLHPAWKYLMLSPSQRKEVLENWGSLRCQALSGPLKSVNLPGDIKLSPGMVSDSCRDSRSSCEVQQATS